MKIQSNMVNLVSRTAVFLLLFLLFLVHAEEFSEKMKNTTPMQIMAVTSSNSGNTSQQLTTGNNLWDGIIKDCLKKPSMSCFQKNVYSYLDDLLETSSLNVTNRLLFMKNQVDYTNTESNEIPEAESRSG
ncbi:Osi17 family protein, partial [Megaselia abdita]